MRRIEQPLKVALVVAAFREVKLIGAGPCVVHSTGAKLQIQRGRPERQEAHLLPSNLVVNGRPLYDYVPTHNLMFQLHIKGLFGATESVLPSVNSVDTDLERWGQIKNFCTLIEKTISPQIPNTFWHWEKLLHDKRAADLAGISHTLDKYDRELQSLEQKKKKLKAGLKEGQIGELEGMITKTLEKKTILQAVAQVYHDHQPELGHEHEYRTVLDNYTNLARGKDEI